MAADSLESYEKFNYLLRPCKQIERRLLVEALQKLSDADCVIRDYRYIGFGSVFYADFMLFHKHLYINDMWCVEKSDIPKRMKFNKPYEFIKVFNKSYVDVIPEIDRSRPHLVWLDYDYTYTPEMLADINSTLGILAPGSVFIITVDGRPQLPDELDDADWDTARREEETIAYWRSTFEGLIREEEIDTQYLGGNEAPKLFYKATHERIQKTLNSRSDQELEFMQLFNVQYADGAMMLTIGGVVDTPEKLNQVKTNGVLDLDFINQGEEPIEIAVPHLTVREKLWLDSRLKADLRHDQLEFELREELFENYRKYYRDYPTFTEALM